MPIAALAHQNNFDIAWCKGSVAEKLFVPVRGTPYRALPSHHIWVCKQVPSCGPAQACKGHAIYIEPSVSRFESSKLQNKFAFCNLTSLGIRDQEFITLNC